MGFLARLRLGWVGGLGWGGLGRVRGCGWGGGVGGGWGGVGVEEGNIVSSMEDIEVKWIKI